MTGIFVLIFMASIVLTAAVDFDEMIEKHYEYKRRKLKLSKYNQAMLGGSNEKNSGNNSRRV